MTVIDSYVWDIMIRAIIFDLNGVFINSPFLSDRFEREYGVKAEEFLTALKEVMPVARKPGAGDSFRLWKPHLDAWGVNLTREQFFDFWFSAEEEAQEMVMVARKLKQDGLELFILSNNFEERADYYGEHFPFLHELFRRVYYSWQTGFVKPDIRAFEKVLSDNGLGAAECIYVDNMRENVDAAERIGMKAILFKDPLNFKDTIQELI